MKKRRVLQTILFYLLLLWANVMTGVANDVGRERAEEVAQQITVTGTVTDMYGETLIGVTVMVKGATIGTATDMDGRYTINVPNRNAVLTFSYVGFSPYEQAVGDLRVINVVLNEDTQVIDEVVVIGYGTVRKSDLTGSVVSISSDKFKNLPQAGVSNILQGKAAGVNIISTSGNGNMNIRIRGITSLNKSSEPLWVVDGVIDGRMGDVNDIQSIEVLKDASSTAIYGSRGANGVILVTTKKAVEGPARVTFDTRLAWNTWIRKPELLSPYEYAQAYRFVRGENAIPAADMAAYRDGVKGVDWIDMMTRNGFYQRYSVNISGGSAKTKYGVSAWADDNKKQITTATGRSYGVKATLNTEIASWLNLSGYMYGGRSERHNDVGQGEMGFTDWSPCMDLFNEATGFYNSDPYSSLGKTSPYAGKVASYEDYESHDINGFVDLRIKLPVDGLTLSLQGLYNRNQNLLRRVETRMRAAGERNSAYHRSEQNYRIRNINNLTYEKQFGDHRLTAMAAMETTKYEWSRLRADVQEFDNDELLGYWVLGSGTMTNAQDYTNSGMMSCFGRMVYSYMGKYSFTGTYRADAPSQFIGKYKWGYFPSAGVAWNISEEDFINKELVQQLKLRASIGTSGNHGVDAYATIANLSRDFTSYEHTSSSRYYGWWPASFNNPDLRWEKSTQYNVGLDVSFLNQRVNITTDWFLKKTTDLLFQKSLPAYNGGGSIWTNEGDLDNSGWELTVNAWPVRSKNLIWETNFTTAYIDTKIRRLAGNVDMIVVDSDRGSTDQGGLFVYQVGKPIGLFYIQEFAGFDDEGATLHYVYDKNGNRTGDVTINNDIGNKRIQKRSSFPQWTYGWNNTLTYKNFDFNIFFRATGAYSRMNRQRFYESSMIGSSRFISSRESFYLSWDRVADKNRAEFASLTNPNTQYIAGSTQWIENGQFLRCQNLSIGYQLFKSTTKFADVHLSLSATNLFVLTKYKGLDPETVSEVHDTRKDGSFGYDAGSVPMPRTYTFALRFDF